MWLRSEFQKVPDNKELEQISEQITSVFNNTIKIESYKTHQSVSPLKWDRQGYRIRFIVRDRHGYRDYRSSGSSGV